MYNPMNQEPSALPLRNPLASLRVLIGTALLQFGDSTGCYRVCLTLPLQCSGNVVTTGKNEATIPELTTLLIVFTSGLSESYRFDSATLARLDRDWRNGDPMGVYEVRTLANEPHTLSLNFADVSYLT